MASSAKKRRLNHFETADDHKHQPPKKKPKTSSTQNHNGHHPNTNGKVQKSTDGKTTTTANHDQQHDMTAYLLLHGLDVNELKETLRKQTLIGHGSKTKLIESLRKPSEIMNELNISYPEQLMHNKLDIKPSSTYPLTNGHHSTRTKYKSELN